MKVRNRSVNSVSDEKSGSENVVETLTAGLYCFKSKSVGYYNPPFLATCDAEAKYRVVQAALSSEGNPFLNEVDSFCLCKVGTFDPSTGNIESCNVVIAEFSEIVASLEDYRKVGE